jgi:hypothetical protein
MTHHHSLVALKEALQQPFAPETIQFLPKDIRQENGRYVCLALPYANKRVYEDRLNELVFGEWSTPATHPYAQGNKLIIPVTVVILGVAHTDYGEAYLMTTGKGGTTREDDNTATEAYSQAFRRACAKFLLGRYLYDLPKQTFPYDPKAKRIAVSKAEQIAWVEKLYLHCGLITPRKAPIPSVAQQSTPIQPAVTNVTTVVSQQQESTAITASQPTTTYPTSYTDTFLDWVCRSVDRDPERIQGICAFYQVQELTKLSSKQRQELTKRLRRQASEQQQSASAGTASV